ncbi:MAG: DUF58 domain-containing protein [Alphaproteobacteria bacterium]|nr:DUF58 domain-containing protein [Alphaproteobacteria bacterium]MCB9974657.1 DUF58 domain-containing protein [Rhodospirillales bacterium]
MLFPDFKELVELGRLAPRGTLSARRKSVSNLTGDYKSPFRGRGLEFEEVREYVAGDDVRNIDWRVTARTGLPHIKLFSEERERSVIVCIDRNDSMRFGTRVTFKSVQAAKVAALIGWSAVQGSNRLGASFFGNVPGGMRFFGPRRSRNSLWRMFHMLCDPAELYSTPVKMDDHLLLLSRASAPGSLFFIISDFLDPGAGVKKALASLHRRGDVVLISVNDPADALFSKAGTLLFTGEGGKKAVVDTDDRKGRESYEKQWLQNRQTLDDMVKVLGLGFVQMYTNSQLIVELSGGLRSLGRTGVRHAEFGRSAGAA